MYLVFLFIVSILPNMPLYQCAFQHYIFSCGRILLIGRQRIKIQFHELPQIVKKQCLLRFRAWLFGFLVLAMFGRFR